MLKLKKIPFIVSIVLLFIFLVSIFSISSFAASDFNNNFESDDLDLVQIDDSYFRFEPSLALSSWPNYVNDQVFYVDFQFDIYGQSSIRFQRIMIVYYGGVLTASYHFSTDPNSQRVDVWTWDGSSFNILRNDLLNIHVSEGSVSRSAFTFLNLFTVPAARNGLYRFVPSSSYIGTENFAIPFFIPNDSEHFALPSILYGRKTNVNSTVDFIISEFYYEYEGSTNYEQDLYSLRYGFASDSPSTVVWSGELYLQFPAFFNSYSQYNAFTSLFYLVGSDSDPNYDYSDGFSDGYDEGYSTGYFVGEAEGTIKGFDEGLAVGKENGYSEGYDDGYSDGENASGSASLGKNLLGETLSSPFNAFMNIKLFDLPNGNPFTLGTVFTTLVSLFIFIIFLKMFAGG